MRVRGFVRRWVEDVVGGVVDDALDVLDLADYGAFSDLGERVDVLEGHDLDDLVDRLEVLEGLDLEETVERVTGLEVQVEAYALEGASDRERIEALEARVETVAAAVKGVLDLLEAVTL